MYQRLQVLFSPGRAKKEPTKEEKYHLLLRLRNPGQRSIGYYGIVGHVVPGAGAAVVQKKEHGVSLSQSSGWVMQALTEREVPHGEASALLADLRRAEGTEIVQTGAPEALRTP